MKTIKEQILVYLFWNFLTFPRLSYPILLILNKAILNLYHSNTNEIKNAKPNGKTYGAS